MRRKQTALLFAALIGLAPIGAYAQRQSSAVATADVREHGNVQPPKVLRDGSYYGRRLGHGEGYVYTHDDPSGFEVDYLPDELKGREYYRPSGNGEETE